MSKHILLNISHSTTRRLYKIKPNKNHLKKRSKKIKKKYLKDKIEGGLRFKNLFKKSELDKPLISIVTVTYNCRNLLERTIKSVLNLSYDNIEFIIVDGGSTDNTLNIIKKYNNYIDFWISQKDSGIYNAMNKGSKFANGDMLFFLNAGDKLINREFIKLAKLFKKTKDLYENNFVLCGTHVYTVEYPGFKFLKKNFLPILGRLPSHQSMLIPRRLQLQNKYDEQFPISADKDFKLKIYLKNVNYVITNHVVCLSLPGGKSQSVKNHFDLKKRTLETFHIFKKNYNFLWATIYSFAFYMWNLRKILNKA
jgi:glycosyltransferase involved in cell wall biosynthesis